MITIEKGVPIPNHKTKPNSGMRDLLRKMEVGDSFAVPKERRNTLASYVTIENAGEKKFTIRRVDEKTIRVWRIS